MHANCRCTTIMAGTDPKTRIARDPETGKNYKVDGDMNFSEWKDSLTDEQKAAMAKHVDKFGESGIINYAKASDLFKYEKVPKNAIITPQSIVNELSKSPIGNETIEYIQNSGVLPELIYEPQNHTNRGEQRGKDIKIYVSNNKNDRVAACTIIHEITHQKYDIGKCQWAEAVCMAKEKMHIEGRNQLTYAEKKYIVGLATSSYSELNWKKGGYKYGRYFNR